MIKTERLFDKNSKLKSFSSDVILCEELDGGNFAVVLSSTAFFPSEGGQACDTGTLAGQAVLEVYENNGIIYHIVECPIARGEKVDGEIDFAERFRKMQNHTGEHIISGLIHTNFGYNNVGFHLGKDDMTADFDGELCEEDIRKIERLANSVVFDCRKIRSYYPSKDELLSLEYRSKLEITSGVRIVEIEGIDKCACCAPHVENTGEVGIIKILDYIRYKGGTRMHIRCGYDALTAFCAEREQVKRISMAISAKPCEIADGVDKLLLDMGELRGKISELKQKIQEYKLSHLEYSEGSIILFENDCDMLAIRNFVNSAVEKTGKLCAVFAGNDSEGYKYIIGSQRIDLKSISKSIFDGIGGKGGGSSQMLQGGCLKARAEIEEFFKKSKL